MKNVTALVTVLAWFICSANTASAQDWKGIEVPARPPQGMQWQIQPISDSFDYKSTYDNRPASFTDRWNDTFINPWTGPSRTKWTRGHAWTNGSELGIQANHDPESDSIFMGCVSSKKAFKFPLFVEARAQLADCTLANNVWMLSNDSTEEIDIMEVYPSSRLKNNWFDQRIHLSHHVFIRKPFQDYQPIEKDGVKGTWYWESDRKTWRGKWLRTGVYWKSPWHLEYYINGEKVRTMMRDQHKYKNPAGKFEIVKTDFNAMDKLNYTKGTGLSKPMHIIINMEQQSWITDRGIIPNDEELDSDNKRNVFFIDWLRVYQAVDSDERAENPKK